MGRRPKEADLAIMFVRCDGAYAVDVAGESHYQEAISECVAAGSVEITSDSRCSSEFNVRLVREPDNQYDANAVAVTSLAGRTLGYLPRAVAGEYAPVLDRITGLAIVECAARAYGRRDGSESPWIFGIWLDFPDALELSQALAGLRSGAIEEISEHEWRYVPAERGVGRMVAVSCPACGAAGEAAPGVGGFRCRSCQKDVWVINCRRCHQGCTIFGSAVGSGALEFRCGNCRAKNIVDKQRLRAINAEVRRMERVAVANRREAAEAEKRHLAAHAEGRGAEAARRTGNVQGGLAALTELLTRTKSEAFDFSRLKIAPAQLTFSPGALADPEEAPQLESFMPAAIRGLSALVPGAKRKHQEHVDAANRAIAEACAQHETRETERAAALHRAREEFDANVAESESTTQKQHDDVDQLEARVKEGDPANDRRVLQRRDQLDQAAVRAYRSRSASSVLPRITATGD
jgi:hypothetical protein